MAISTRTGNILSKLIRKLDELCVYTDSNAQLRSLTYAEPDGTVHDSAVGELKETLITTAQTLGTSWKSIGSITLSAGTWSLGYNITASVADDSTNTAAGLGANIQKTAGYDYNQVLSFKPASVGTTMLGVNRTVLVNVPSGGATYYLNARAYNKNLTTTTNGTYITCMRVR